jgi:hypothetical protein
VAFPYPGNATVKTPDGTKVLRDVLLSLALSIDTAQVTINQARRVECISSDSRAMTRSDRGPLPRCILDK